MATCDTSPVYDQRLSVTFPGGLKLQAQPATAGTVPPDVLARQLVAQASAALAPLAPIFDLIGFASALKDFVLAAASNPFEVASAASKVVEKADALAALVPQLSVPILARDLIDVALQFLRGLSDTVEGLADLARRAEDARALAEGAAEGGDALREAAACADAEVAAQVENLASSLAAFGAVFDLLDLFLGLVPGAPRIGFSPGAEANLEELRASIVALEETLRRVRRAIPG